MKRKEIKTEKRRDINPLIATNQSIIYLDVFKHADDRHYRIKDKRESFKPRISIDSFHMSRSLRALREGPIFVFLDRKRVIPVASRARTRANRFAASRLSRMNPRQKRKLARVSRRSRKVAR